MKNTVCKIHFFLILFLSFVMFGCAAKEDLGPPLVNLQANKDAVMAYYKDGGYEKDIAVIAREADAYLDKALASGKYEKPVVIFDIDDTLLDNHGFYERTGYRFVPSLWTQWVNVGEIPPIPAMNDLFNKYVGKVDMIIITGRNVMQRAQTKRNLKDAGYVGATSVFFKEAWDRKLTAKQYKARILTQLMDTEGFQIIANFGDQESDFGVEIVGQEFRLPNYLYITK